MFILYCPARKHRGVASKGKKMSCTCLGEFNRPPIFNCVAKGLADSSLNPTLMGELVTPLRFVAALVVAAVSPIFAACDLLIYLGAMVAFSIGGYGNYALENLQDCGLLLLRFIPDAFCFPFVFACNPDACLDYTRGRY